jgi:hypothetical protein
MQPGTWKTDMKRILTVAFVAASSVFAVMTVFGVVRMAFVAHRDGYWAHEPWSPARFPVPVTVAACVALVSGLALGAAAYGVASRRWRAFPFALLWWAGVMGYVAWLYAAPPEPNRITAVSIFGSLVWPQWSTGFVVWGPLLLLASHLLQRGERSNGGAASGSAHDPHGS